MLKRFLQSGRGVGAHPPLRPFSTPPPPPPPKKTALYEFHVKEGGKMVPFAGYLMPVQYSGLSITQSHLHTRHSSSIFDVSHMLQTEVWGKDRSEFMELLVTGDIRSLPPAQGTLTLFTNREGGIIDDLIVSNTREEHLYVVSNAGCRDKDQPLLLSAEASFRAQGKDVKVLFRDDLSLIALQGPTAAAVLSPLLSTSSTQSLYFMQTVMGNVAGVPGCRITRCGYTGEDGFELSVPSHKVLHITGALLSSTASKVELAGLGARDSLRLEAGLCLYGNDMDESTTPVEAGLGWLVGKGRKERGDFPGAPIILEQMREPSKVKRRRVGLLCKGGGPPPRAHMEILSPDASAVIGEVTSGCPSPSLAPANIAMGYVEGGLEGAKVGAQVRVRVRGKEVLAEVTKLPFIKGRYYVPPKK